MSQTSIVWLFNFCLFVSNDNQSIKVFILTPAWFPITNEQRGLLVCCILLQLILRVYNALIYIGDTYTDSSAVCIAGFKHLFTTLWLAKCFIKGSLFDLCSEERRFCDSPEIAFKRHFIKLHFPLKSLILWGADFPSALTEVKAMGAVGVRQHPPQSRHMFPLKRPTSEYSVHHNSPFAEPWEALSAD